MRKAIIASLLAAVSVPTVAQAQNAELRHDRREIREEQRDVREARREYREDWRDYRARHPEYYRGPGWVGPRGYRWRPVTVGYRFQPVFYERRYWIDPYRYHLRPVRGYERWVRYGNDVVLIDIRSGRVLDVHSRFFF